jgi:hypothetical protein
MTKFAALLVSLASMGDTCDQKSKTQSLPLPTSMVMQRASITRLNSWFHGTLDILMVPSISKLDRAQKTCALSTRAIDSPENGKKKWCLIMRERYIYKYITNYILLLFQSISVALNTLKPSHLSQPLDQASMPSAHPWDCGQSAARPVFFWLISHLDHQVILSYGLCRGHV